MREISTTAIEGLLPARFGSVIIGYSGGIDSQVLMHLCASLPRLKNRLVAVYIHHGLQKEADDWCEHCRTECLKFGVEFKAIYVDAAAKPGESPEAAARNARYSAFERLVGPDDVLLLAQHREDQMETVLLQLFRGGGIHGLAGMPARTRFGRGMVLRPFLAVAKQDIQAYAARNDLQWVEDPSNSNCDFDRNFLRNRIVPLLKQRWPTLDKTVARTAGHCGDAMHLLDEWCDGALASVCDVADRSLSIGCWQSFNERQRAWLLRQWLKKFGLRAPSQAVLQAVVEQVIYAKADANPEIRLQGHRIKKYRDKLYCLAENYFHKETESRVWNNRDACLTMKNGYCLRRNASNTGIDQALWNTQTVTVAPRRGGEKIKLRGRDGHHCLKKLYQEGGIPSWEREVRPLIYLNGSLAAVAGLWVAEWAVGTSDCYRLSWQP